jgi:hypothetical protein
MLMRTIDPTIMNETKKSTAVQLNEIRWSLSSTEASGSIEILRTISDHPSCVAHSNMVKSPVLNVPK